MSVSPYPLLLSATTASTISGTGDRGARPSSPRFQRVNEDEENEGGKQEEGREESIELGSVDVKVDTTRQPQRGMSAVDEEERFARSSELPDESEALDESESPMPAAPTANTAVPAAEEEETGQWQGLTLVHFSAQPEPFLTQDTP